MTDPAENGPRQLPMEFGQPDRYAPEDLVVTDANRAAARLVGEWPKWPAPVVVLVGPKGSGKTHLASIWQVRAGATAFDATAIGEPDVPAGAAALVENADNGALDETGLFHLINAVQSAGGSLLVTGRRLPTHWGVGLDDLSSRLRAATVIEIAEPDDVLLSTVITKLFADRQLVVPPHVVRFLIARMDRSLETAIRIVERIDALSLEKKNRITRAMAAEALAAMQ